MSNKRWQYRGEGGANLVISMPQEKVIVRFPKSKYVDKDQEAKIREIAYFSNEVMRPLLGRHFVRPVKIGQMSLADLEQIRIEAQPYRPLARCKKGIYSRTVILSPDCVFLTPDYEWNTKGDTFSVEIKPKQGWHSLKASCSVDLCHRCLKQYAKLYQGEIDAFSPYCPLDLFSGDKSRMKRAIFDLYEEPHNRFKLFKNGDLIYTNEVGSMSDMEKELSLFFGTSQKVLECLTALLCTSLLLPLDGAKNSVMEEFIELLPDKVFRPPYLCDTRHSPLPKNGILQRLLTLQRHTEMSDHEAKVVCERLLNNVEDIEGLHQLVFWHPNSKMEHQLTQSEIEDVIQLQRYLLSVTAKDVSLMITFREVNDVTLEPPDQTVLHFKSLNKYFRLMISVIDLDPKPVHRISSWVHRKEEWLKIYFNLNQGKSK